MYAVWERGAEGRDGAWHCGGNTWSADVGDAVQYRSREEAETVAAAVGRAYRVEVIVRETPPE